MPGSISQPLLSICIPTYNRARFLRVCLDSVFFQFSDEKLKDVSDNASPDSTEALVLGYQKTFPQLKYFRNPENIGFGLNLVNSVTKAAGKYGWYLGDDDALAPGCLKYITEMLTEIQPAVVGVASAPLVDPDKVPAAASPTNLIKPTILGSFQEFMAKGYCLGILSVILFDRELWLTIDRTKFLPSWLYYEVILKLMPKAKGRKFAYIGQVCVYVGKGYGWVKNGGELNTFLEWKDIFSSLGQYGYDENWIRQELKPFPRWLILILLRAKGHDLSMDFKHLERIYKSFSGHAFYLALATFIFYVPNFIIKAVRNSKNFLAGKILKI